MSEEVHPGDSLELERAAGPERTRSEHAEEVDLDLPPVEDGGATEPLSYEALPGATVPQTILYDGVTGERIVEHQPDVGSHHTVEQPQILDPDQSVEPQPTAEPQWLTEPPLEATEGQSRTEWTADPAPFEPPFVPLAYTPESTEDTVRQNGLAYSAGIAFFGSVAFTLFLGWIVDVLLGSSPWGIVGGIIIGSIIGFVQFFSITSRIFPNKDSGPAVSPLSDAAKDPED